MSLSNRPYIGTWQMRGQTSVKHSPDAIVLINGHQEMATCPTCNKGLDLNRYITNISVDGTTDPVASANISLSIPRYDASLFSFDGNHVLKPGLEVIVFMKGYFPMKGFASLGQDPSELEGFDPDGVPLYPYYQVFRGVTTNVSHGFSGGFYTATLQCSNLLHFWQNLKLSTNGAVMGKRPADSQVQPDLRGHKFTSANPYAIIYTLVRVGFGAAYGVEFMLGKQTSISAKDGDNRKYQFKHAAEWWEKRWTEHSGSLRMYGIDGRIFNAFEQAYLGAWYDTRGESSGSSVLFQTAQRILQTEGQDYNPQRHQEFLEKAQELGYDPLATRAAVYDTSGGNGTSFATEDVLRMQAFTLDVGRLGSINMFETEYMSKLEIVERVKSITGFEFYQDVDGDLVFKPPLYNMDTRDDPVYVIEDRDLISINPSEGEPEATMVKGTGSHFANLSGHGIEGWLGVGGVFIDYKLVAQYGYREETFESNYLSSRQALFVSAINRLDMANVGVKSASITIPLRPELRPGFPVYVRSMDCFYYVRSFSHSYQAGGQCNTQINGVAKRAKWLPPMETPGDGSLPDVSHVRLDAPGEFPAQPMMGFDQHMSEDAGDAGPPRNYGFPNVVLALDPDKINLATVDLASGVITAEGYIQIALTSGILERGETDQIFYLRSSNEEKIEIQLSEIEQQWTDVQEALKAGTYQPDPSNNLGLVLAAIQRRTSIDVSDSSNLNNYLALQTSLKGTFAPGTSAQGRYRYFSCSHPDAEHQAPGNLYVDHETSEHSTVAGGVPDEGFTTSIRALTNAGNGKGIALDTEPRPIQRGIKVAALSQKEDPGDYSFQTEVMATSDIRFVTFGPQTVRKRITVSRTKPGWSAGTNFGLSPSSTKDAYTALLESRAVPDPGLTIGERFEDEYFRILGEILQFSQDLGVDSASQVSAAQSKVSTVGRCLDSYAKQLAEGSDGSLVSAVFIRKSDLDAVRSLASSLSQGLWAYTRQVVSAANKLSPEDWSEFMDARESFIRNYTDGVVEVSEGEPGVLVFRPDSYEEINDYTPIFPVSDAGGYEVYGNLPYGRGVGVEAFASLMDSTTQGDDSGDATTTSTTSTTWVGGVGSNASDLQAIEKFIILFLAGEDPQTIFGKLSATERDAVLAASNTTEEAITREAVESLQHNSTSQRARIRNTPVTSFFRGMSQTGEVAAANLADLSVTGDTCVCKGADAATLLSAFSEEFIDLFDDPVQGFLEQQAAGVSESHQFSREAMAGSIVDSSNEQPLADFSRAIQDSVGNLTGGLASATDGDTT